jgi:hypothetical protein
MWYVLFLFSHFLAWDAFSNICYQENAAKTLKQILILSLRLFSFSTSYSNIFLSRKLHPNAKAQE